ncbi:hypothetical protein C7T94_17335 [Pedobacter yulinensis]|uniref:Uncharacterized protein n=1 Tax=Pedobacter yulinensis TaxID=2126353 RepID=A0A2T3HHU9_9SPHI|nr:hypothetical protein [Pedobacter yulinensis]PST81951.1 hypothetical protein C7T94_17335 [Pedobacter yulinensis]
MNSSTNPDGLHNSSNEEQERLNSPGSGEGTGQEENQENEKPTNPEGIESLNQGHFSTGHTRRHKPLGDSHEPGTVPGADTQP